jgi:hypothetical protein
MTSNISTNSKDSSTEAATLAFEPATVFNFTNDDLVGGVLKLPSGDFYYIHESGLGFKYIQKCKFPNSPVHKVSIGQILLEVNRGAWTLYLKGDESWKENLFTEEELAHKTRVLKCIIYQQLCLEANDDLIDTLDHDNYLKNTLKKANKELERKAKQSLTGIYAKDPEMLTNIFSVIDDFVALLANKLPHEYFYLKSIIEEYDDDPKKFIGRKVSLNRLDV